MWSRGLVWSSRARPARTCSSDVSRLVDAAMAHDRVEDVIVALEAEGSDFARHAASEIGRKSPTSLRLTLELLKRASRASGLRECLVNEFRVACRLLQSHDLYEGIRAAIIDKDHEPAGLRRRWRE